jgi:hypothetical protein
MEMGLTWRPFHMSMLKDNIIIKYSLEKRAKECEPSLCGSGFSSVIVVLLRISLLSDTHQ